MTISLTALPVRHLTLRDLSACLDLAADRGWPRDERRWRLLLTAGRGYGIDTPAGDDRGGLLAAAVLTRYQEAYRSIGMVLVAARHSRRGVGRHLMRHLLGVCGDVPVFLAATGSARPLYEELGFKPVGALTILTGRFTGGAETGTPGGHSGHSGPGKPPGEPAEAAAGKAARVRPATAADLPQVLALDLPAFGTDRTELIARLPSYAERFVVAERPGGRGLTGFAAAVPGPASTVIGPVVAENEVTARALIARLGTDSEGPVRLDLDTRHHTLESWLREHGLGGENQCTLMVLGAPGLPGDIGRRFAPYSVALG